MIDKPIVHLDFDRTFEILRKGVRRSDVFMGVGLNSAEHQPPISHILAQEGKQQIHLVKQELTDNEKIHVAKEFGKWIQSNGLREILESFSIFLNELYLAVFLIRYSRKELDREFNKCRPEKFERMGIGAQIERFSHVAPVSDADVKVIRSLNKARNCYAHRQGLVSRADLDEGKRTLSVFWNALEMQIKEDNGNVVVGNKISGRTFEKGGMLQVAVKEQSKDFTLGSELIFEKQELKAICLCVLSIGERLFRETVSIAKNAGLLKEIVDSNPNDPKPV